LLDSGPAGMGYVGPIYYPYIGNRKGYATIQVLLFLSESYLTFFLQVFMCSPNV